mgnify:CR=1 FL=1
MRAIAYQQLHAKAGDAIVGRLVGLFPGQTFARPEQILATDFERLRAWHGVVDLNWDITDAVRLRSITGTSVSSGETDSMGARR